MIGALDPTLQPIQGKFPIVGVWRNSLIVEREGALRAVGAHPAQYNLYLVRGRLRQGEPLRVVTERVAMQDRTLRWLASRIETYNPASYRGGILILHYARARELEPWLDLVVVRGEVIVQFWLRPGEAAVTLGPRD
ncbi:MAG: hypothetical protein EA420_15460 [Candidatus Competibacteraceae bacterium]|nr:MAG: hypothetical protein EA420_15460 [Candidatus Competibacteraceae bacterium]